VVGWIGVLGDEGFGLHLGRAESCKSPRRNEVLSTFMCASLSL
jgi:hypothetical protein